MYRVKDSKDFDVIPECTDCLFHLRKHFGAIQLSVRTLRFSLKTSQKLQDFS